MAAPMEATADALGASTPAQQRIAKMIRAYMAATGEKQSDLALLLGVEQPQVSKMLSGRRKLTVDELERIAVHYDRHPGAFFEGFDEGAHQNLKDVTGPDLQLVHASTGEDGNRPGPGQLQLDLPPRLFVIEGGA